MKGIDKLNPQGCITKNSFDMIMKRKKENYVLNWFMIYPQYVQLNELTVLSNNNVTFFVEVLLCMFLKRNMEDVIAVVSNYILSTTIIHK